MGFSEVDFFLSNDILNNFYSSKEKARSALSTMHWNTSDALESLCKG
jgi:hypothetical protein